MLLSTQGGFVQERYKQCRTSPQVGREFKGLRGFIFIFTLKSN